ncbi:MULTISPECIES: HAMP domain-containing sensor histidine kinase [unclassified Sphingobacterium]|uniref:HAMP domain-containing sensor histidine kinase n=1 Tax=unclassified Sphingobacterium TaxID=2609468 RepID=UPI0025FA8CAE|nr:MULTISPECIES: HAMP domain-containing sensor histidine kinase [unclassified Sphingobacterium]
MQIRTRITILFTVVTAAILTIFACTVYFSAVENREKEFYALLKKEAYTKANLFLNAKVDKKTLEDIYHNNRKILNEVEVAIYDTSFKLLYHDAVDIDFVKETPVMLQDIVQKKEIGFYQDKWQVIGITYAYNNINFIITAAAYDQYGYNKLQNLLSTIVIVFIFAVFLSYAAGIYFSKKVFRPVQEMTRKVKNISANSLDARLESPGNKDELSELANTFNDMLNRLESSFDAQKHFVSNISHELRTPLAAMIAELEISTNKDRSTAEYKIIIDNILNDAQKLKKLFNSLLDFAKASYDSSEISFRTLRVDELLLDACQQVLQANSTYKLDIFIDPALEDEQMISIIGNEYLLRVAFMNLIENACKFSDNHKCSIAVKSERMSIQLEFKDDGIGIEANDLERIFTPFYRGNNKAHSEGNGIGLSLTQKIILLHQGEILVRSTKDIGSVFRINLPHSAAF